jgi:Protein of unknown function (DUF4232)
MRRVLLASVLAAGIAGCGGVSIPAPSTPTGSAPPVSSQAPVASSAAPSAPASAAPTSAPTPKPAAKPIAVCLATQLTAKVTGWQGAAGSQIATVTLTNKSTTTCTVRGTPEVELIDVHGAILIDSQTGGPSGLPHIAPGAPAYHVAHNGFLTTEVEDSNYCGAAAALPTTIAFVLPSSAGRLAAAPGPGGSTPPCNGAPGSLGSIAMNGWVK